MKLLGTKPAADAQNFVEMREAPRFSLVMRSAKLLCENPVNRIKVAKLDREIDLERANLKRPMFQLNLESALKEAALVVVDEASMIGNMMGEDLISFGCPVLALGDPARA